MTNFDLVPQDLGNIIISFISSPKDLENLVSVFPQFTNFIQWDTVNFYSFGEYDKICYAKYVRRLDARILKDKLELNKTVKELEKTVSLDVKNSL